jgi:hypothetical protein
VKPSRSLTTVPALLAVAAALAVTAGTAVTAAGTGTAPARAPRLAGCPVLPADSYWNTPVDGLPVHPRSAQWRKHMSPSSRLHPDFGPSYGAQPVPYGIPITVVGGGHPKVHVHFGYASESDKVRYPFGRDTKIEGGRSASGDRHAIVVDRSTCRLYETWSTRQRGGRWTAGSGAVFGLASNRLRPDGWTSADAAGLPILPGLLRLSEVRAGYVGHAIRFTTDVTDRRHIWPARHDAGSVSNRAYPPMGARFRLKAGFDLSGYRADTRVVLRAMKRFGMVLADNGSPWYFQGQAVKGWPTGMLDELKGIPARAFEAVDTSSLRISNGSGRAHQP